MISKSILLTLLAVTLSSAQPPLAPLSLADCIRKALVVPSSLTIARLDRSIADRDIAIARSSLLPHASAVFGGVYSSPSRADRDTFAFIPSNAIREYIGLGRILQEIDTSGRIRAEIARARANQNVAQASAQIVERDLKRAVSLAYYRLLLARRIADAISSSLTESQAFERRVKLLAEGGEAARADVVKSSTKVAILRQTLNAARQFSTRAQQLAETKSVAERRYSQEYRAALARSSQFLQQIAEAKEQMNLAEEDFKLSRIRYEGGEGAAVEVVVAQSQLVQARTSYYTSIANYLSAKLDLEVAAGR